MNEVQHPQHVISADDLLLRLDFRDPEPEVIDLSPEGGVVSTLQESKIECLGSEKVTPQTRVVPDIDSFTPPCRQGCISILFSTPISWSFPRVPIGN